MAIPSHLSFEFNFTRNGLEQLHVKDDRSQALEADNCQKKLYTLIISKPLPGDNVVGLNSN